MRFYRIDIWQRNVRRSKSLGWGIPDLRPLTEVATSTSMRGDMRVLSLLGCTLVLMTFVAGAYAASGASFSGDRSLIAKFRLDDGTTGGVGYRRATWWSDSGLRASLVVKNSKGKTVESLRGGNPTAPSGGLTWILASGEMINHTYPPAGLYRVTLTLTAYAPGSVSRLTGHKVVAKWSARIPDHKTLCVPHVSGNAYIGCG